MEINAFIDWLNDNTEYTKETKSNIVSRLKRANSLLPVQEDPVYLYYLSQKKEFMSLSAPVKSQIRRAVKLYYQFTDWMVGNTR